MTASSTPDLATWRDTVLQLKRESEERASDVAQCGGLEFSP